MTRTDYYVQLKALARDVRLKHGLTSPKVTLTDMRRIYKSYGVKIVLWKGPLKDVRGAYINDDLGPEVMVSARLPKEQRIFTMGHELKHHLTDPDSGIKLSAEEKAPIEIGAEIFAAELIFPEADFAAEMAKRGITATNFTPESIVRLKRETETTLSFTSLGKRAEFLGFTPKGSLAKTRWKKLEEGLYGEPVYKRIQRIRAARKK